MKVNINIYNAKTPKPKRAKRLELTVTFGELTLKGEQLMGFDLKEGQSFDFIVKPVNSKGGIAAVDGPITIAVTGETSVDVFFDEPNRTGKVSYLDGGPWKVDFSADGDLSAGVRTITASIDGVNAPLEATSLIVEAGPIQP